VPLSAKDVILLGEAAARGATMLDIRCSRCTRHGRLSIKRLLAEWGTGANASLRDIMRDQLRSCPHRVDTQLYIHCDPYSPTLLQLFSPYPEAG